MTERTEPRDDRGGIKTDCPMTAALSAIGGKWNLICLYWLDSGERRFNELRRLMPGISSKVLTQTLRTLEHEGLITRIVLSHAPDHVEYTISPHGETVRPLMHAVRHWGRLHLSRHERVNHLCEQSKR